MEKLYFDLTSDCLDTVYDLVNSVYEKKQGLTFVAFDGMSGSGKRTIAHKLRKKFPDTCKVFHVNDYNVPLSDRTPELESTPLGTFDVDRFKYEVIKGVKSREPFYMTKYDLKKDSFSKPEKIKPYDIIIVEGHYSLHPDIADLYDLKIFFKVSNELQKERILRRSGSDEYKEYLCNLLPAENRYFEEYGIEDSCDYAICVK